MNKVNLLEIIEEIGERNFDLYNSDDVLQKKIALLFLGHRKRWINSDIKEMKISTTSELKCRWEILFPSGIRKEYLSLFRVKKDDKGFYIELGQKKIRKFKGKLI
jgi:hypothetical protein